jgi:exopolyphosphatase / guanosine-5'-triphosphate,3'-diphosphate pyrophosphatase
MAVVRRQPETADDVLGAIDVGTNAVRLELARVLPDGSLETLHTERDPVRPGEGLFTSGLINKVVADRLISTLRRYAALCRRYGARVRAVATSAVREAKNKDEIVRRARDEAGLTLEVVSGREEARLICLGVLHGKAPTTRSLCIDIGGGSTEIIFAAGETPKDLWSVDLGSVRVTELFKLRDKVGKKQLTLIRNFTREMIAETIAHPIKGAPSAAIGSSGTIGAIVAFARSEGMGHATMLEVTRAVEELADMDLVKRRKRFDPRRADIIVGGTLVLEAVMRHLKVETITAVDRGLREGVLYDLVRRRRVDQNDHSLADAAVLIGARFGFSEPHARQVARLSLALFDELAGVHQMPAAARPWLEVAALLHDVGHSINYQKHHKHTHYLILNADIPGLTDRERALVGAIARFHRRSPPTLTHELMQPFTTTEARIVRKCATILRVADSLDRSHRQPVQKIDLRVVGRSVQLKVKAKQSIDLELWDLEHERELFREVFGKSLNVVS